MRTCLRRTFRSHAFTLGLAGGVLVAVPSSAASWQNKVNWGGSMGMDLYVPDKVDASPGLVVSLHYCGGNSGNAHGWFEALAAQYGFIVIAPQAGGDCFDAAATRSGERDSITKMVSYVITQKHVDAKRVFAAGASSGACMAEALVAAYPDVFAAGSVLAGVPAGAWTGGNAYGWTTPTNRTAQQWGDLVRNADPGFNGTRPRLQLWHGSADMTLSFDPNFAAEVAQWTNVFGVSSANSTQSSFKGSMDTWARISYKNGSGTIVLETNVAQGAPHDLSGRGLWPDVVRFFGLDQDPPTGGGGSGSGGAGSGGSGGVSSGTGGSGSGGKSGSGGSSAGGPNAAGGAANGGANTAGQTSAGSGNGGSGTGGSNASGGSSSGGTSVGNGGATNTGSGGSNNASGGASTGSGGQSNMAGASSGGATNTGTGGASSGGSGNGENGCSCALPGATQPASGRFAALTALALGLLLRRKRRP